jgi:hypothetical protein
MLSHSGEDGAEAERRIELVASLESSSPVEDLVRVHCQDRVLPKLRERKAR